MATYFVRKSGSDAGDGSTGNPWLTVYKAVSTIPSAGGHTVNIGAGTYAEDAGLGASGFMRWVTNFAAETIFQAEDSANRPVIYGTGVATYSHICSGGNYTWKNLVLGLNPAAPQSTGVFFANNANCNNLKWDNCDISAAESNSTQYGIVGNWTGSGSNWTLSNGCRFLPPRNPANVNSAFNVIGISGGLTGFTASRVACFWPRFSVENVRSGTLSDSAFVSQHDVALIIGKDGDGGGLETTLNVTNVLAASWGSHAALLGDGATGVTIDRLYVPYCVDYGLVVKAHGAAPCVVKNSLITAGGSNAKTALYFKGSSGNSYYNNTLYANGSGRRCLGYTASGAGVDPASENVYRNTFVGLNGAEVFLAAAADYGAGNRVDQNLYLLDTTSGWGGVLGASPAATMDALRAAWLAGGFPQNDAQSRAGVVATDEYEAWALSRLAVPNHRGSR